VQDDSPFSAGAILLDGWFYVDVAKSAGIEFDFPTMAFERLGKIQSIPCLFLNSQQFTGYPKLWEATGRLAGEKHPRHVLEGTKHNNFCDLCFWFPTALLRYAGAIGGPVDVSAVGTSVDPREVYQDIIQRTSQFLRQVLK
jgi:hypothetical protein